MLNGDKLAVDMQEYAFAYNRHRSEEYNLAVGEYPSIPRLNEDYEDVLIEGKNGSYTIMKGTYRDRIIRLTFKSLDIDYFWSNIEIIEKWLKSRDYPYLFYDRVDKCFVVKRVEIGDIRKEMSLFGQFEVTFLCEPFMQDLNGITYMSRLNSFSIENRGDFPVEPKIELTGSGNMEIKVNNETIQINNVSGKVTIEKWRCYDSMGSKLKDMNGDFPLLEVGTNNFTVNNKVSSVTITYNNLYR